MNINELKTSAQDRPNKDMTVAVDQALHIQTLAGSAAAAKYLSTRGVPLSVIGRVLAEAGKRRKTLRAF